MRKKLKKKYDEWLSLEAQIFDIIKTLSGFGGECVCGRRNQEREPAYFVNDNGYGNYVVVGYCMRCGGIVED